MQPLTSGVRAGLSASKILDLLQSQSAIRIDYGAAGLDENFNPLVDLTPYMTAGSTITSDGFATVHRTCNLMIDSNASNVWNYLSGFIQPYMTFTDRLTGFTAQFNLGVYTLTTPSLALGTSPSIATFAGYDLIYLLQQVIGDSYEIKSGVDPAAAAAATIEAAIPGVKVDYTPSDSTLAKTMTFPMDASSPPTYLSVISALLNSIGYRPVWVDWEGTFRIESFTDPQDMSPEWIFDLSDRMNIVAEDRAQDLDLFDVPNWFRFVMDNLTGPAVEGTTMLTYQDNSAINPGSIQNRGRLIKHIEQVTVSTFLDLQTYAKKTIQRLLNPSEIFSVTTQPLPLAWHMDVFDYNDTNLANISPSYSSHRSILATGWTMPLDGRSDMQWTWQTITDQTLDDLLLTVIV